MKHYSKRAFARAIMRLLEKYPRPQVMAAAAKELLAQGWKSDLEGIENALAEEALALRGELTVDVVSAHPLSGAVKRRVQQVFQEQSGARAIMLREHQDPRIGGGLVARSFSHELDISVKSILNRLKHHV